MAIVILGYRPSSSDDTATALAEQRWLHEAARLRRQFAIAAFCVAAGLVATCVEASFGQLALARVGCFAVFGGIAWVIYLCIQRQRRFMAIKMAGGMTRQAALSEFNARSGG